MGRIQQVNGPGCLHVTIAPVVVLLYRHCAFHVRMHRAVVIVSPGRVKHVAE